MHHTEHPKHNCKELSADISLLLDGELNRHAEQQLLAEIENCSVCKQYYNSHASYKTNVSLKVVRMSCGEDLKEVLRAKIRGL